MTYHWLKLHGTRVYKSKSIKRKYKYEYKCDKNQGQDPPNFHSLQKHLYPKQIAVGFDSSTL